MDHEHKVKSGEVILCYSHDWTRLKAAEVLCREASPQCEIVSVTDIDNLLSQVKQYRPDYLIVDVITRDNVGLLCELRRYNRKMLLIILQENVMHSDESVAEYLGRICLVDTTGMTVDTLRTRLSELWANSQKMPISRVKYLDHSFPVSQYRKKILGEIEKCLQHRLADKIKTARLCQSAGEAREWFSGGDSVKQIVQGQSVDVIIVYRRRASLCQLLNVRPRELPDSLNVAWEKT